MTVTARMKDAAAAVYDGQTHIGFVILRERGAYEGFDAASRSLGIFAKEDEAATAVWCDSRHQEPRR